MRKALKDSEWKKDPENQKLTDELIGRSKEPFYCYEPYVNRTDGKPSWQWKFLTAAGDYKGRIALGANRIGKSMMGGYECALAVTGQHPTREFPDEGVAWIVGLDNAMLRDIDLPMFEQFIPERFQYKYYKQDNIWELKSDGRHWTVVFKSTEMGRDKFQGAKIDLAWIDEEPKRTDLFSEIEARLIDRGGCWMMTATPVRGTQWLKKMTQRSDVFSTFAGMRDNPHIPIEEIESFARQLPEDERAVRVEGQYIVFGGRPVFDRRILQAIQENIDIQPKRGILEEVA